MSDQERLEGIVLTKGERVDLTGVPTVHEYTASLPPVRVSGPVTPPVTPEQQIKIYATEIAHDAIENLLMLIVNGYGKIRR